MLQRIVRPFGRFRQSLRQQAGGVDENRLDVQLCDHEDGRPNAQNGIDGKRPIHAEFVSARFLEWAKGAALASIVLCLIMVGLLGLVDCMVSNPNQRGWVIIGLMYYVGTIWTRAWESLRVILWKKRYVRVVVDRTASLTLYEAITKRLVSMAETRGAMFGSRDVEAFTQYDPTTGMRTVQLSFWGTQPRQLSFRLGPTSGTRQSRSPIVTVDYHFGDSVICGRDAHVERNRSLIIWIPTTAEHVAEDKVLLQRWCEECVAEALEPPPDRVEIYGLQESSSDWVPEWKLERTKPSKNSGHVGDLFYLERCVFNELQADARIWAQQSLRLYMVTGPPGVGKTEFTVWLAGFLRMPIYRLSLTMASLTDARLAQLLSQSSILHETVVVQVDEFQEVMRRWDSGDKSISVTPGGFNEVLQGSTTLAKGIIVLTGTSEVANEARQREHAALFRRFHVKIELGYLDQIDASRYFRGFLIQFVDNSDEEWQEWESQFTAALSEHGPAQVSIDIIKQYLMRRITAACAAGVLEALLGTNKFYAVACRKDELRSLVMCGHAMASFFKVHALGSMRFDGPSPSG